MIRPYLCDMIIDGEQKIQSTMSINFISSKDSDKIRNLHTKGNNISYDR